MASTEGEGGEGGEYKPRTSPPPQKRRFTEEKPENEEIRKDVLGYQVRTLIVMLKKSFNNSLVKSLHKLPYNACCERSEIFTIYKSRSYFSFYTRLRKT